MPSSGTERDGLADFAFILFSVLVILRASGAITIGWPWVFAPLVPLALPAVGAILFVCVVVVVTALVVLLFAAVTAFQAARGKFRKRRQAVTCGLMIPLPIGRRTYYPACHLPAGHKGPHLIRSEWVPLWGRHFTIGAMDS